jgi:hypothetical protein
MRGESDIVARISGRQHGRVSRAQLLAAGIDRKRIDRWLADGRLRPVHRGVYAVGHAAPSPHGDYMAAVLACGDNAALSHRPAAYMMRLRAGRPPPPEVTVPTTADRGRPGIVVHRVKALHVLDTSTLDAIAITTVPRTLLDLAPTTTLTHLTRLCHEAWVRHDCGPDTIQACIARNPYKPGAGKLRRALGSDATLSDLEDGFLKLLNRHDLPRPRTNIDRHGDKVDCHWPQHDLTIELVSYRYHATRHAFEHDIARRRRSNHTAYTYGDIFERGNQTAADVAALLARASG